MNNNQQFDWFHLLKELTIKEISVRYKKTSFGFLWMFLNPLSQMFILGLVFQHFTNLTLKTNNYYLFLFVGLIIWNFFSNSLYTAIPIYVNERALLQKSNFPREVILLSVILSNLFHYLVSVFVLVLFLLLSALFFNFPFNIVQFVYDSPLIILTTIWLGSFTLGVSAFLSALNVKYRDIQFFTNAALPLLFYVTPIFWELHFVPQNLLPVLYLNPLAAIVEVNRAVLLSEPLQNANLLLLSFAATVITTILGIGIFKKESTYFDDWL